MTTAASSKSRMPDSCSGDGGALPPAATIWQRFAKMLGIREDQAEDALKSERAAKLMLSRRAFMGAAGVLAAGTVFAFPAPAQAELKKIAKRRNGSTLTSFDALLKERYSDDKISALSYDDPYLRLLKHSPPQVAFMNPRDYAALAVELGAEKPAPQIVQDKFVPLGQAFIMPASTRLKRGALT